MADAVLEHFITYIYKDKVTGELQAFYPRTLAVQVVTAKDGTMQGHIDSNKHMSLIEAQRMHNSGQAGGYVYLDENGMIPLSNLPDDFISIKVEAANIAQLLTMSTVHPGAFVMVVDASDDPDVHSNWAVYRREDNSSYDVLATGWKKVFEKESIDMALVWDDLQGKPVSSIEEIDAAVELRHTHLNKAVLDNIGYDTEAQRPTYNGEKIAYMTDVTKYHFTDYMTGEIRKGDFWMKTAVGQSWWGDATYEYGGSTMYERYMNNTTMVTSPKVRTHDAVSFRRCFKGCTMLETSQQYDVSASTDFLGMYSGATKIESVPPMNASRGLYFDEMFAGCVALKYSPELNMRDALTLDGMFRGCVEMERVLPLGDTHNVTSAIEVFAGCTSLVQIDDALDFSSVASASRLENIFFDCTALEILTLKPNTLHVSLNLADTALNTDSVMSVLAGLATIDPTLNQQLDLTNVPGVEGVDAADLTAAAEKGWTIITDDAVYYSDGTTGGVNPQNYEITSGSQISEMLAQISNGDTITINDEVDTTAAALNITKQNIKLVLNDDVVSSGSPSSGIRVTGGSATLSGTGVISNATPYDSTHGAGVIGVYQDGNLTINGGGIAAVISDDPVNKGQFGVVVQKNGKLTINDGVFDAGWYCVSGNGSAGNKDSIITINGGTYTSAADYCIYHPQDGTLNITGGTFRGAAGALAVNRGTINISGGEFYVLGGGDTGEWSDGTSGLADVAINLNGKYGPVTCRITGGKFHATAAGTILIATGSKYPVDLQITGGKFTEKPNAAWIPEGYACSDDADSEGYYVVGPVA